MLDKSHTEFLKDNLMFWDKLSSEEKKLLFSNAVQSIYEKGDSLHNGKEDCNGLILVKNGQLRAYIFSEQGKEITLYRLFEKDVCIMSASCMLKNITFDIYIEAEKDSEVIIIPSPEYQTLSDNNISVQNFTNQIISSRFSDVMWVMEQIVFMSFDKRLALFLLEQSAIENSDTVTLTHEAIAKHLGSAREVVSRMLKYFQNEGLVKASRGSITILNRSKLNKLK